MIKMGGGGDGFQSEADPWALSPFSKLCVCLCVCLLRWLTHQEVTWQAQFQVEKSKWERKAMAFRDLRGRQRTKDPYEFAWAATAKCHWMGGLNSRNLFPTVLQCRSLRSRCQWGWFLNEDFSSTGEDISTNVNFLYTQWKAISFYPPRFSGWELWIKLTADRVAREN